MPAERFGNILWRGRIFLVMVVVATMAGSLFIEGFRSNAQQARMEVLVAAHMVGEGQYDVELSRATASDFIVDDLGLVVRGSEFAALVAARFSADHKVDLAPHVVAAALTADRTHRGLELKLTAADAETSIALAVAAADVLASEINVLYPTIYEVASLSLIDLALIPDSYSEEILALIVREIGAFVIAVMVLVLWDAFRRRLYAEDVGEILNLPILARFD